MSWQKPPEQTHQFFFGFVSTWSTSNWRNLGVTTLVPTTLDKFRPQGSFFLICKDFILLNFSILMILLCFFLAILRRELVILISHQRLIFRARFKYFIQSLWSTSHLSVLPGGLKYPRRSSIGNASTSLILSSDLLCSSCMPHFY